MPTSFDFNNEDGEAELRRWLGERLPEFVTLSDHIWKILVDSNVKDANLKNEKLVDAATAFVKSGGSCFEKIQLTEEQLAKFHQLIPSLISLASITVKGGLAQGTAEEDKPYNKEEAAAYLNISVRKLEQEIEHSQIDHIKGKGKTGKVQFRKPALDAYLQRHTRSAKLGKK